MAKLKSFEQFLSEMDRAEEVQQDVVATAEPVEHSEEEAEEVQGNGDAVEEAVNASGYIKAGKLGYNDQFLGRQSLSKTLSLDLGLNPKDQYTGTWLGFDHVSLYASGKNGGTILDDALTGKYTYDELKAAAADFLGIKESEEVIEESCAECNEEPCVCETEQVSESGEEAGLPVEDLKDETKEVDNDVEAPEDKSDELEAELEDTVDGAGNEEISESEESEETEEVAEEEEETKAVSDMLSEVYEACKNEAKAWESDAHDEHTVETYMKENAALVGALAAKSLKEMKEDYSVEAYESACNEMIEAYTKKVNEMKESDSAVGEETPEA
jgi:hypothetical protein